MAGESAAPSPPTYLVDVASDLVRVQLHGRASIQNAVPLKRFFAHALGAGSVRFVVDFARCEYADSTVLGILIGVAQKVRKAQPPGSLDLVGLPAGMLENVRTLGLDRLARVSGGAAAAAVPGTFHPLAEGPAPSPRDTARVAHDAHRNLVQAHAPNAERFKDVIRYLREAAGED